MGLLNYYLYTNIIPKLDWGLMLTLKLNQSSRNKDDGEPLNKIS